MNVSTTYGWLDLDEIYGCELYDHFWGVEIFPFQIDGLSSKEIDIRWECSSYGWREDNKIWESGYLIICTRAWDRAIDSVDITFNVRCDEFKNYEANYSPSSESLNEKGYPVISFHYDDFNEPEQMIVITGDEKNDPAEPRTDSSPCFISITGF